MMLTQELFGTFTLGNVCWMYQHTQQQAIGVNQNMPFATVHFFFRHHIHGRHLLLWI